MKTKGQARGRVRSVFQCLVSSVAMIASGIMLSEFLEDICFRTNNMPVPRWMKPMLWLSLAIMVSIEGTKVREDIETMWSSEGDD